MKIQDIPTDKLFADTPDLESRLAAQEQGEMRLWLRLLSCATLIENEIRSRLRREFKTTLPRFELMAQLHECPEGMRMTELSRRMLVTNGNITGITDQLEKEGMLERHRQAHDRRSSVLRLTPQGKKQYQIMAAAYREWLSAFFAPLSAPNKEGLLDSLGELKLLAHIQTHNNA
ncbi:MAG TPA: MarR family transcriptional regulator [Paenalcaligenes sp.]|nr:MarR family transcriptional regulator [Paenalcaligenes sp.]